MFRALDETIFVSLQITADDIATAAAQGVTLIINNRQTVNLRLSRRDRKSRLRRTRRGSTTLPFRSGRAAFHNRK